MSLLGAPLAALDTPALVVDHDRLMGNIQRYATAIAATGAALRPHIKTHKTVEIAAMQMQVGASGSTCAKLGEAEVYAAAGCSDIFVAYPVIGREKARRAAQLARQCHLIVGVESAIGIAHLSAAACDAGIILDVRLELESGLQRTGATASVAADLCRQVLDAPGLRLEGIFTFRGVGFDGATGDAAALGRQEGEWMVAQAARLRAVGIAFTSISVGSTPTAIAAAQIPGITEVRPGTYVFCDRLTNQTGACVLDDIALTILATVVSRPAIDIAIIDAGSKSFCGDIHPPAVGLTGFGVTATGPSGIVERMNEEHGIVRLATGFAPAIGEKMAFYPNHVCTAVNLANELIVMQAGIVRARWDVAARGKQQ